MVRSTRPKYTVKVEPGELAVAVWHVYFYPGYSTEQTLISTGSAGTMDLAEKQARAAVDDHKAERKERERIREERSAQRRVFTIDG